MMSENCQLRTIVSAYTVIILFGSSSCLKIVGVEVPSLADFRLPATLECSYDTGQDALYSVKWYKDDHELFRYMPFHTPNMLTFPLNGAEFVTSDCGKSKCKITLKNLTPEASGAYTCEVSTEGPAFRNVLSTSNMTVTELPPELPKIDGLRDSYTIGEILDVTCTPPSSSIPPDISFYLNNEVITVSDLGFAFRHLQATLYADSEQTYNVLTLVDESLVTRKADLSDDKLYHTSAQLLVALTLAHFKSPSSNAAEGSSTGNGATLHLRCSAGVASIPETVVASEAIATLVAPQLLLRNQKLILPNATDKITPSLVPFITGGLFLIERILIKYLF